MACKVVAIDNSGMLPCDYCVSTRTYSFRKGKIPQTAEIQNVNFSQTNLSFPNVADA